MEQNAMVKTETENVAKENKIQEYLSFVSDGLNYIISAENITEIIMNQSITHLPKVPAFIKGIINLRGQAIPVIDARMRMGLSELNYDEEACIIVINIGNVCIGLLVERVSHMVNINEDNILPPPNNKKYELVDGIVDIGGIVYLSMDCEKLIN